jgi:soluble lytic murein transglycosylase
MKRTFRATPGKGVTAARKITHRQSIKAATYNGFDESEFDEEKLFDPSTNIRYGTMFLSILYERYGNWDAVYAAYHAGHGRVDKWFEDGTVIIDADGNLTGIPIDATAVYVERVNKAKSIYTELLSKEEK